MNIECKMTNATGVVVAVGSREQMMVYLNHEAPDGEYTVAGPGIDAKFYRIDGVVYPSGGQVDGQMIPPRSREECSDEQFMRELEALSGPLDSFTRQPVPAALKGQLFDRLRQAGIAGVTVEYDGYGDDGCIQDLVATVVGGGEIELAEDLRELVEDYVWGRLPGGWETDDGSFGEVEFDVTAGTVTFEHSQRHTKVTFGQWEE